MRLPDQRPPPTHLRLEMRTQDSPGRPPGRPRAWGRRAGRMRPLGSASRLERVGDEPEAEEGGCASTEIQISGRERAPSACNPAAAAASLAANVDRPMLPISGVLGSGRSRSASDMTPSGDDSTTDASPQSAAAARCRRLRSSCPTCLALPCSLWLLNTVPPTPLNSQSDTGRRLHGGAEQRVWRHRSRLAAQLRRSPLSCLNRRGIDRQLS